jgi:uncharacterized membrane protein YphA (DoxX/SURF4 family)
MKFEEILMFKALGRFCSFVEDCSLWLFSVVLVVGGSYLAGALVAVGFFTPLANVLGV